MCCIDEGRWQALPAAERDAVMKDYGEWVADLERKFPYASALFMSQGGVSINRDRTGKRVSESGFPSRGVMLRVFDGAEFHEAAVGSTSRAFSIAIGTTGACISSASRMKPLPNSASW